MTPETVILGVAQYFSATHCISGARLLSLGGIHIGDVHTVWGEGVPKKQTKQMMGKGASDQTRPDVTITWISEEGCQAVRFLVQILLDMSKHAFLIQISGWMQNWMS